MFNEGGEGMRQMKCVDLQIEVVLVGIEALEDFGAVVGKQLWFFATHLCAVDLKLLPQDFFLHHDYLCYASTFNQQHSPPKFISS
jgi:hypothetical protein